MGSVHVDHRPWEWEECVDTVKEAQGDFVEKCQKQTEALRDCMMADPGYYGGGMQCNIVVQVERERGTLEDQFF